MINLKKKDLAYYSRIIWFYMKYQIISKGIVGIVILPIFTLIIQKLIKSTGRTNLSSGDYLEFLFSFKGIEMLIFAIILLIILTGLDINALIIMSAMIRENRVVSNIRSIVYIGIKSLKSFLKPSGLFLLIYVAIIVPLVSIGITISPMENFQIPNFIKSVIFDNNILSVLFYTIIFILTLITLVHIFTFHYILISEYDIRRALKESSKLMKKYWKEFIVEILKRTLKRIFIIIALIILIFLTTLPAYIIPKSIYISRFLTLFTLFIIIGIIAFITFMAVPVFIEDLTRLFYELNEKEGRRIELNMKLDKKKMEYKKPLEFNIGSKKFFTISITLILIVDIVFALILTFNFETIFNPKRDIEIIVHRGGGDLAAENSLRGLEKAIELGADRSEFDVQRTRDNQYIINHDMNFKRLTGEKRKSSDMDLDEIERLKIKDTFNSSRPSQKVARLEEFLDTGKNNIGLFIELKGNTADRQMADDIVRLVKERGMEDEIVLLSLDYELIKYIEEKYPEMKSGFLYFFSIGDIGRLKGDYLIMEEREASKGRVEEIQKAGKKAIVWTVNTPKSIDRFVKSNVDGIITDHFKKVKDAIKERDQRSDFEIIIDKLLDFDK
ncbi:MAG: glycerophosphodiester phosphodiesterase family protein [Andreesenia angusta]|nr:glycerophosphodiester phosphodiesterase family protein [Andreesenia angusta]